MYEYSLLSSKLIRKINKLTGSVLAIGLIAMAIGCSQSQKPISPTQLNNFLAWCQNRDRITNDAKQTVNALLGSAKTNDCQQANKILQASQYVFLKNQNIKDLQPLSSLAHIHELHLQNNNIDNIEPLAKLINLRKLYLENNKIRNIAPLKALKGLQWLDLGHNSIDNLQGIDKLTDLDYLQLDENKIVNITPLSNLNKLTYLGLSHNQISDVRPLAKLRNLRDLGLRSNRLTLVNVRSLNNLPSLSTVSLEGNDLGQTQNLESCPIAKPGITCIY